MGIAKYLSKIFEEELEKIVLREQKEDTYLPDRDFKDSRARFAAATAIAKNKVDIIGALAVAIHREEKHKEDHVEEIKFLSELVTEVELEEATKMSRWWSQ